MVIVVAVAVFSRFVCFEKGSVECGGDAHDTVGVDPRRVHAQAFARLRRQLSSLSQHIHAAAGARVLVCSCAVCA